MSEARRNAQHPPPQQVPGRQSAVHFMCLRRLVEARLSTVRSSERRIQLSKPIVQHVQWFGSSQISGSSACACLIVALSHYRRLASP